MFVDELAVIDVGSLCDLAARRREPSDPDVTAAASAIDRACRRYGFFLVTGHGVPAERLAALDAAARAVFALPDAEKAEIAMVHGGSAWRGWFPEGGELTAGRPDHKEGLYFGAELADDDPRVRAGVPLHGANLFPAGVPELRGVVLDWIDRMTTLGQAVLHGVALGLGLEADWFLRHLTGDPTVLFRIFRYPCRPAGDDGWGVAEHTDYGLVTVLAHDGSPGLQVHGPSGWLEVDAPAGTFVVNVGDLLARWTRNVYRSTPHRVRYASGAEGADRLSFPFFLDPSWDAEVPSVPLDGSPPPDDVDSRWDAASVHAWSGTYGDYLTAKVARVFPDLVDAPASSSTADDR